MSGGPEDTVSPRPERELALGLAALVGMATQLDFDNTVLREVTAILAAELTELTALEGSIRVVVRKDHLVVGSVRLQDSPAMHLRFALLGKAMADRGIDAIVFHSGATDAELTALALVLAMGSGTGPCRLNGLLRSRGVTHIEVESAPPAGWLKSVTPAEAYWAAVRVGHELRFGAETARHLDLRRVRRTTQVIVDLMLDQPRCLLPFTTLKEVDPDFTSHAANVAILSVLLGRRLGLARACLGELCLAGFLHDAGKLEVAPEVLSKAGPLDAQERTEVRGHPVAAARALLGARRPSPAKMRAVTVAYEHHRNHDGSGYPPTRIRKQVSLFGDVVAIADRYDALTTARSYRRFSLSPHEVVGYLLYYAGTSFDPLLVKLFVEVMGLFPPGTVVRLSSGDLAVVCDPPPLGRPADRPIVRLLGGSRSGETFDLGEAVADRSLDIAMVLSPAGQGQVPALPLGLMETQAAPAARSAIS